MLGPEEVTTDKHLQAILLVTFFLPDHPSRSDFVHNITCFSYFNVIGDQEQGSL